MNDANLTLLPTGVRLSQWHPSQREFAESLRQYCLNMIQEVYGYDYRQDWHRDLDSLLSGDQSDYSPNQRGCMLVLQNEMNEIIGTAGMRGLFTQPKMLERFPIRFKNANTVASNCRMYIRADYRRLGMSKILIALRELAAQRYGYSTLYLHCDINAHRLRQHWESFGFENFCNEDQTSHYDKSIPSAEKNH